MRKEAILLPLFAAVLFSIAVSLAISWAGPVSIAMAGVSTFVLLLKTGWKVAGIDTACGATAFDFAGLWLIFALLFWFAIVGPLSWLWLGFAFVLFSLLVYFLCRKSSAETGSGLSES
ncbi:MAG TPA: hypothetical protein PKZ32_07910 [Candidatus Melainabacteria bacterium]|nr:hypothetical protein [Candidatus Melainabacteria bacterium]